MKGTMLYGARDVRFEERPDPTVVEPTDAIIKLSATCVCGSDLWPYRGIDPTSEPRAMGHEYVGIVEEVGREVKRIKKGQFVVGSFFASDNTCEICRSGYQTACVHRQPGAPTGAQAQYARIPLADGTLVATPDLPGRDMLASLLSASDVFGTGWFAADAAAAGPGKTVDLFTPRRGCRDYSLIPGLTRGGWSQRQHGALPLGPGKPGDSTGRGSERRGCALRGHPILKIPHPRRRTCFGEHVLLLNTGGSKDRCKDADRHARRQHAFLRSDHQTFCTYVKGPRETLLSTSSGSKNFALSAPIMGWAANA